MRAAKFEVKLWQERYAQDCRRFEPNPGLPRVARKFRSGRRMTGTAAAPSGKLVMRSASGARVGGMSER
jgi:hypothetical protein